MNRSLAIMLFGCFLVGPTSYGETSPKPVVEDEFSWVCRTYSDVKPSSQSCREIYNQVFAGVGSERKTEINQIIDSKCRDSRSDQCLLRRMEINALIKNRAKIIECRDRQPARQSGVQEKRRSSLTVATCTLEGGGEISFYTLSQELLSSQIKSQSNTSSTGGGRPSAPAASSPESATSR